MKCYEKYMHYSKISIPKHKRFSSGIKKNVKTTDQCAILFNRGASGYKNPTGSR